MAPSATGACSADALKRPGKRLTLAAVAIAALVLAGVASALLSAEPTAEGTLPPFEVEAQDGSPIRSGDLVGEPLFINAWASWCIPCREETPGISRLYEVCRDRVRFVGLNVRDQRDDALDYARDLGITYPIAFDRGDAAYAALRVSGVPTSLFVDRGGTIVRRVIGPMTEAELAAYLDEIAAE